MTKQRNYVAAACNRINRPATHKDKKKSNKRGDMKHKGKYYD
jgi:hypothetical protein